MQFAFALVVLGTLLMFDFQVDAGVWLVAAGLVWIIAGCLITCHPTHGTFATDAAARRRRLPHLVFILPAPALALASRTIAPGHRPPRFILAA
jgi:hypothetical protein